MQNKIKMEKIVIIIYFLCLSHLGFAALEKKAPTMKKRNYQEIFFISEKFSVIYLSKKRVNFISLLYYN